MANKQVFIQKKAKPDLEQLHKLQGGAIKKASKQYNQRVITHGIHTGKIPDGYVKKMDKAFEENNVDEYMQLISRVNYDRGLISMPDLIMPLGSSIRKIKVSISSTCTEDEQLLHKLLNNT